jgi:acyl-CoA reductase-like NAD-dependent aldehyde dehydrogenase
MSNIQSISPVDGSIYAERPVANAEQVAALFARSKAAQFQWAQLTVAQSGCWRSGRLRRARPLHDFYR